MLVKNWMSKNVVAIDENETMDNAIRLLREHKIRLLPVMSKGKLTGVLTDRDLKRASASDATSLDIHELMYLLAKIKVKQIMTRDPVTVPIDFTVEETAELMLGRKISGVPVLDHDGRVAGVITQTDIDRVLISLTGVGKRGIQFAMQIEDRPGSIKEVADILRAFGTRMVSLMTSYEHVPEGYRKVYIRVYDIDRGRLHELKTQLREKATLLYMIDHRENRREIY